MIIGKKTIYYKEIDSTNDEAKRLIKKGAGEGLVVVADSQTAGRGKPGSSWFSPPGAGVYLSAIIKPFKNPQDLGSITQLGARAAASAIRKTIGLMPEIKLPNDVILKGKKVCGILVERTASGHLIIGIGIDLNNPAGSFPSELKNTATSLKIESGKDHDLEEFIRVLLAELDREYLAYLNEI
jgi:BirA family biotin operon repressor/biotin-[acetyl-CoA-carboxylase] ligase